MKLIAYMRTSVANGDSVAAQNEAIEAWAAIENHSIVRRCSDDGRSGTLDASEREGLADALAALEAGEAKGLVVHRLDRLARQLHIQEAVLAQVWKLGGQVFTTDGGEVLRDDPEDPMRVFVRQVMGAAAQLERGMIVARMQGGRRRARAAGRHIGGDVPYGYRLENGQLMPEPSEQEIVSRIVAMRASGRSFRSIAAELPGSWHAMKVKRAFDRAAA